MTSDGSIEEERSPGDGAHQGAGRWAQRGAAGMGIPPGESGPPTTTAPPTADDGDPDISPSLAGGHAGGSGHE